jgi:hypothetical protein
MPIILLLLFLALLGAIFLKIRLYRSIKRYASWTPAEIIPERQLTYRFLQYVVASGPEFQRHLKSLIAQIESYDVVALQGAHQGPDGHLSQFIADAEGIGFRFVASGAVPEFFSLQTQDSGILILSKWPLNVIDTLEFNPKSTTGAVYVRMRPSAFEFINIIVAELSENEATRFGEVAQLTGFARKHVTDELPFFIFGNVHGDLARDEFDKLTQSLQIQQRKVIDLITYEITGERKPASLKDRDNNKRSTDVALYLKPPEDIVIKEATSTIQKLEVAGTASGQPSTNYGISVTATFVNLLESE